MECIRRTRNTCERLPRDGSRSLTFHARPQIFSSIRTEDTTILPNICLNPSHIQEHPPALNLKLSFSRRLPSRLNGQRSVSRNSGDETRLQRQFRSVEVPEKFRAVIKGRNPVRDQSFLAPAAIGTLQILQKNEDSVPEQLMQRYRSGLLVRRKPCCRICRLKYDNCASSMEAEHVTRRRTRIRRADLLQLLLGVPRPDKFRVNPAGQIVNQIRNRCKSRGNGMLHIGDQDRTEEADSEREAGRAKGSLFNNAILQRLLLGNGEGGGEEQKQ